MLTKEQLVELNNRMLQLGAPIERDNVGYNKPDFALMKNLAYIPPEMLTDEYAVILLDTLNKYSNTQLEVYKQEIKETAKELKESLIEEQNENVLTYLKSGDNSYIVGANEAYIPNEMRKEKHYNTISVVQYNETGLLLDFEDVNVAHRFKNANEGVYYTQRTGDWKLFVPYDKLSSFIELMENAKKKGIDGYVASEQLKTILKDIPAFLQKITFEVNEEKRKKQEEEKKILLISNNKEKEEITIYYKGFNRELNDFKNSSNGQIKSVNIFGEWQTVINYTVFDEWMKKAQMIGLIPTEELKAIDVQQIKKEKELELLERHTNHNHLVSLEDLPNLPFTPYPFQLEDAKHLLNRDKMLIGHDMGCGKTFISGLLARSIEGRKLVICPETLRLNWKKEMAMLGIESKIQYSKDEFQPGTAPNAITIVGYQTVSKFEKELSEAGYTTVFVDEVHNCKAVNNMGEPDSKRASCVINLVQGAKYGYLLSGTPVPTRNKDLYNVLRMLDVEELDFKKEYAFFEYGQEYCAGLRNGYGWDFTGNSKSEELHELLTRYMVRRTKKEVLPNLTKQRICIPLEIHNKEYEKIEKRLDDMLDNDTYMGLAMTGRRLLSESKVKTAIEFADGLLEEEKAVVIVSNFNDTLDTIKQTYGDNCCVIRGGMTDTEKQKAIDDFQSGRCKICALNLIAGGVGVTLTAAHNMVICDYDWTPANMIQVEDRICRAGQTEGCNIHYLYGSNCVIDEIFIQMITGKNANIDKVVDGSENGMNLTAMKEEKSKSYLDILKEYSRNRATEATEDIPIKKRRSR